MKEKEIDLRCRGYYVHMKMSTQIEVGAEYDAMGETVEITNETSGKVCVHHPERESPDGGSYTVWRLRESVEAVAEFESWERMDAESGPEQMEGEFIDTPRCDGCGAFMSTGFDDLGFPAASCQNEKCSAEPYDVDILLEDGYFKQ